MKNRFSFIVMATQNSGTGLVKSFLDSFSDMHVLDPGDKALTLSVIESFFEDNPDKIKGIWLKSSRYAEPEEYKILEQFLAPDCAVLEISLEPLQRIISQLNRDIYNWAMTFVELYWLSLNQLEFGKYGSGGFLKWVLDSPMQRGHSALGPLLREKYAKYLHVSMPDINEENMENTLNKFRSFMGLPPMQIQYPAGPAFSTRNNFHSNMRAMYYKGEALRPCPVNYLAYVGYNDSDICLIVEPAEVNFPLGDHSGKLAFCFYNKQLDSACKEKIRQEVKNDLSRVTRWCNSMTRLYTKGLNLYEMFDYNEEKLRSRIREEPAALKLAQKYFTDQFDYYARYEPQFLAQCLPSIKFLASISR